MFIQDLYFFSSFTLAKKRRKEVPRKEENQAGFRTLRVHYGSLSHSSQRLEINLFFLQSREPKVSPL